MNFDLSNPLDLRGPEFLGFYLVAGVVINVLIRVAIRLKESGGDLSEARQQFENAKLTDPYEIAYLRGGPNEALRIASVALIDRGLLTADASNNYQLKIKDNNSVELANRPIEKWLLLECLSARRAADLFYTSELIKICKPYQDKLTHLGLLPNSEQMTNRHFIMWTGGLVLIGLATAKIFVALSHIRHNILFLIILCAIFTYFTLQASGKRRTGKGDRFLDDLKSLFFGLKVRSKFMKSGGATNELALLTAVFGLSAASTATFPYIRKIYQKSTSITSTSNCGTSCGAGYSYSSCGGSSCGGGGCGGGCGGCGS